MRQYPSTKQPKDADWESKQRREALEKKTTALIIQFCKSLDDIKENKKKIVEISKELVDTTWETYPDRETDLPTIEDDLDTA